MLRRFSVSVALAALLLLALACSAMAAKTAAPKVSVKVFANSDLKLVESITAGPDGNIWFVQGLHPVGRMTPNGAVAFFPIFGYRGITAGPDGNIWFPKYHYWWYEPYSVVRMAPDGTATEFSEGVSNPQEITAGPDGNIWFTERSPTLDATPDRATRITPNGTVTAFPFPISGEAADITAGPDGNIWLTDSGRVVRVTPQGVSTVFSKGFKQANDITAGPDGNIWFTDIGGGIVRMTPQGAVTKFKKGITGEPAAITKGPDGALWFTEFRREARSSFIGRITPQGVVTEYQKGLHRMLYDITTGPNRTIWAAGVHQLTRVKLIGPKKARACGKKKQPRHRRPACKPKKKSHR